MMQKLEKLIDVATEALSLYVKTQGGDCPDCARPRDIVPAPVKEVKTRAKKDKAVPAETAAASPFDAGVELGKTAPAKLNAEEAIEAGRRGQEVMGLFIRRYLKASPTGLERAKKIINETLGLPRTPAVAWKLEDFTPEDWLKLTPKFEQELDKAGA